MSSHTYCSEQCPLKKESKREQGGTERRPFFKGEQGG